MRQIPIILGLIAVLFIPVYASAQLSDRITLLDNFGTYESGEPLFIYGQVASVSEDAFLIIQIINPYGDLCQIQQLTPLTNGAFVTDAIPLKGIICGIPGEYDVRLFYGENTKDTAFEVSATKFSEPSNDQKVSMAQSLIADHTSAVNKALDVTTPTSTDLSVLESAYVDLWHKFSKNDLIYEIDPLIRNAVTSSLDTIQKLLSDDEISFDVANSLKRTVYASVFYYEIGDRPKSIGLLADAFVDMRNVTPEKITKRSPTFDELEATLLNLMKKSGTIMGKPVKHEVGVIFARGTAPVHSEEIAGLIDMLSKSRYLDVVSRKQSDLYNLIQSNWDTLKPSLQGKESIEDLLESASKVLGLHQASILLRELDGVERFISSDSGENSDLANLLSSDWDSLESKLALATSVENILEFKDEINQMTKIIDISSRISKGVKISQSAGASPELVSDWKSLLERVKNTQSTDEILKIVSEFDNSITELREKRNPLSVLKFEYDSLKKKAELQADYANLVIIDNALKILNTAKQMESGNPSVSRIDRIEVLLAWASEKVPQVKASLDSYSKDVSKVRASDVLQRAKSLENLVNLSLTKNRFLPNYVNFTDKLNEKIDDVRDLVIKKDLDQADKMIQDLFDEWTLVSKAYTDDPQGSKIGYSIDELRKIELREKLDAYDDMVDNFYNSGYSAYHDAYERLDDEAHSLIAIGNFVDAETKITEIGDFLSKYLVLTDEDLIYDISFDPEKEIWVISGATKKSRFDYREDLYVTVYTMSGKTHSSLEFTDTRQGNFHTQWAAPTDPGLYVVMLQYLDSKSTQIVHVEEKFDNKYSKLDLNMVDLAREFKELESFAKKFGGKNFEGNTKFTSVLDKIKRGFSGKNVQGVGQDLTELRTAIERYLPARDPAAPIEAVYDDDKLVVTGRVLKLVEFSEDLFVDIYDQRGKLVKSIALRDDPTGLFNEVVSQPFDSGIYVIELQYHDKVVTDFFNVK